MYSEMGTMKRDGFRERVLDLNSVRKIVYETLYRVNNEGAFLNLLLRSVLDDIDTSSRDKALITELCYGIMRLRNRLDYVINQNAGRPVNKIDADVLELLRIGTYQLLYTRVPSHAAVNETVEVGKAIVNPGANAFLNAVLRSIEQNGKKVKWPKKREDLVGYLSVCHSHPDWLVSYLLDMIGSVETEQLCSKNNSKAPLTLRVNLLKTSIMEFKNIMDDMEIEYRPGRYVEECVTDVKAPVSKIASLLKDGYCSIQDESSMLVAHILDPQPGDFIVDACAAPGGKTLHIAERTDDQATVMAIDINEERLNLLRNALKRMNSFRITTVRGDASNMDSIVDGKADRILVDAPCSDLGTVRRRPDVRWKRSRSDIEIFRSLQERILNGAARTLKPGGVIVYSVCTITYEETMQVIHKFLGDHQEFYLDDCTKYLPIEIEGMSGRWEFLQFMTHHQDTDGMFIARLVHGK